MVRRFLLLLLLYILCTCYKFYLRVFEKILENVVFLKGFQMINGFQLGIRKMNDFRYSLSRPKSLRKDQSLINETLQMYHVLEFKL